jgi:hypothetical protein
MHLSDTYTFEDAFRPKKKRCRPKLAIDHFHDPVQKVDETKGLENFQNSGRDGDIALFYFIWL